MTAGQAQADGRCRTDLTHRAAGWPKASLVRGEIPVRADPPRQAGQEAALNQWRQDRPREVLVSRLLDGVAGVTQEPVA
jgi:hypothetical protein